MNGLLTAVLMGLSCYLVGGIPFGFLMGRMRGIDIRTAGSGNIGATNVGRLLGRRWGIACFLLDVLKGLAPVLAVGALLKTNAAAAEMGATTRNLVWLGCGILCIFGHNFPPYLRFRGGKGVATSLGVVLGLYPYLTVAGLLAFGIWLIVTLTTRYVSLGSICAALALPILFSVCTLWKGYAVFRANLPLLGFAILAAGLVIYRHRGNLARLRAGTESKIGSRRSTPT